MTAMLVDGIERVGLDSAAILASAGIERVHVVSTEGRVPWSTMTQLLASLSEAVEHDRERLREVGRAMTTTAAWASLRRFARSTLSVNRLYILTTKWSGPANFPHVRVMTSLERNSLHLHATIPEGYAPSQPFFHVTEGSFSHLPTVLDLPPAKILESQVTPRSMDLHLSLPRSPSRSRLRARLAALVTLTRRAWSSVDVLDGERQLIAEGVEAVQGAHREQRALLDRLPDMVVVHVQGKIVYANRAFVTTLGWSSLEELAGKPLLQLVDPRSRALFDGHAPSSRPDARGAPQLARASLVARDGSLRLIEIAPPQSVVFDGEEAWLVVGRDIEDRVRLQEQLATADRLASLGLLAAGIAHEVNNPLAYVLNNIEIARRQLAVLGPAAEASVEALTVALEGVDRIRFIVRELLRLSRNDGENIGPVDVRAVIESTLSLAGPEIARVARLDTRIEEAPLASANVARVAQILLNLVLNAIEAMQGTAPSTNVLTVRLAKADDGRVLLEVTDTGPGIPPRDIGRIFEPFFTTKPAGKGTGLGLSITQRLVVELGGHIGVTSGPRRGSTFRVVLPAVKETDEVVPGPRAPLPAVDTA